VTQALECDASVAEQEQPLKASLPIDLTENTCNVRLDDYINRSSKADADATILENLYRDIHYDHFCLRENAAREVWHQKQHWSVPLSQWPDQQKYTGIPKHPNGTPFFGKCDIYPISDYYTAKHQAELELAGVNAETARKSAIKAHAELVGCVNRL